MRLNGVIFCFFCPFLFSQPLFALDEQADAKVVAVEQKQSDQQISEFSLAGYGDKGKKSWELSGKSADIFTDTVKLKDVIGNLYGKEEDIKLTADNGDFNKTDGKVHLEDNVVITTSSGTKMTTDSLDWDRKNQLVTTQDKVNIEKSNMTVVAEGAKGEPGLNKVSLEKNVRLDIKPQGPDEAQVTAKDKTVITCDGPLEIDYANNIAVFNNNVKVERPDAVIYSDRMDIYFIPAGKTEKDEPEAEAKKDNKEPELMGSKIDKIIARGNVKVIRGENVSYSQEAVYNTQEKKLILTGRPQLVIYSEGDLKLASP